MLCKYKGEIVELMAFFCMDLMLCEYKFYVFDFVVSGILLKLNKKR